MLSEEESSRFIDWYNSNQAPRAIEDIYGAWSPEQSGIQKLKNLVVFSWDVQCKKEMVDALVSYRKMHSRINRYHDDTWDQDLRDMR